MSVCAADATRYVTMTWMDAVYWTGQYLSGISSLFMGTNAMMEAVNMPKRVNPRRKPATEADVKAAYERGKLNTIEFVLAAACLSVNDVFSPKDEQMRAFVEKYEANVKSILEDEIRFEDVLDTLKSEYDIEIEFIQ